MTIKRTCQFLLRDGRLQYRVKWEKNRNIVAFNVGYRIDAAKWSKQTQRCTVNSTHGKKKVSASVINKDIQCFEDATVKVFCAFERKQIVPTIDAFREAFNAEIGRTDVVGDKSFFEIYDEFLEIQRIDSQWTNGTYRARKSVRNHILQFDSSLTFEKLNERHWNEYVAFLRETLHLRNTTAQIQVSASRSFYDGRNVKATIRTRSSKHSIRN